MNKELALLKSIEKWAGICFEGVYGDCPLCNMGAGCSGCILGQVGGVCLSDMYGLTSDCRDEHGDYGCDADIHMYLFLCMLYHEYYGEGA
jgi:hypothetical protein